MAEVFKRVVESFPAVGVIEFDVSKFFDESSEGPDRDGAFVAVDKWVDAKDSSGGEGGPADFFLGVGIGDESHAPLFFEFLKLVFDSAWFAGGISVSDELGFGNFAGPGGCFFEYLFVEGGEGREFGDVGVCFENDLCCLHASLQGFLEIGFW